MTTPKLSEQARNTGIIAILSAVFAGGGAVGSSYVMRPSPSDEVRAVVRAEMDSRLVGYVTKEHLTQTRDAERDRLEQKLDRLSEKVERLALAVERLRGE